MDLHPRLSGASMAVRRPGWRKGSPRHLNLRALTCASCASPISDSGPSEVAAIGATAHPHPGDPNLLWNELWLGPVLPPGAHFHLDNVPFAGNTRLSIDIDGDSVRVEGLPDHVNLRLGLRPPLLELFKLTRLMRGRTE